MWACPRGERSPGEAPLLCIRSLPPPICGGRRRRRRSGRRRSAAQQAAAVFRHAAAPLQAGAALLLAVPPRFPCCPTCAALHRPAITLVCKRWLRVFYDTPALWRQFVVAVPRPPPQPTPQQWADLPTALGQWADARAALLARQAGMVEALQLRNGDRLESLGGGSQLARFLRCLRPEAVRHVSLSGGIDESLPEAAVQSLAALTGLTRLQLSFEELPGSAAAVLRQLSTSLRCLELRGGAAAVADTLPLLSQLTRLHVHWEEPDFPVDWCRLTALLQLQHLSLRLDHYESDRQLRPPPPAAFPALNDFKLFAYGWSQQARCCRCMCPEPATLPALLHWAR